MSKLTILGLLLVLVLLGSGATAWWAGLLYKKYTAKALLELRPSRPTVLSRAEERYDPLEFEMYRDTQKDLVTSRFVIAAALRDPKLKGRPCIQREDARHNAIDWLTGEIHVEFRSKNAGLLQISATELDKEDALAMVNAVVDSYMREMVDGERERRRVRLSELQRLSAEKENDLRKKRDQLKHELETIGAGDERMMAVRSSLAVAAYTEALREYNRIKAERRGLLGRIEETNTFITDLTETSEIPETEVAALLNNIPRYRELQSRLAVLEQVERDHGQRAVSGPVAKQSLGHQQNEVELAATKAQIEQLKLESREQVRNAKRIELQRELRRLQAQLGFSTEQLRRAEKEMETKAGEAEAGGRITINAQIAMDEVRGIEQIVHKLTEECEMLKMELNAPSRVVVLGDDPTSPASVSEKPD